MDGDSFTKESLGLLTYGRGKETYTGKYQDSMDSGKSALVYVSDSSTHSGLMPFTFGNCC